MQTYFSLFGLVNIQRSGQEVEMNSDEFMHQINHITDGEATTIDVHTFKGPYNFCSENGRLKIVDYGSRETQQVIEKWGEKIYEEFNC